MTTAGEESRTGGTARPTRAARLARLAPRLGLALGVLGAFAPSRAPAQGLRILGTTIARYLELRPVVDDSVPSDSAIGTGSLRETSRGVVARCVDGEPWCFYRRAADTRVTSLPLLQDLEATGWGLGQGLHAYAHVRVRASAGSDAAIWPQADDAFDLVAAYVDWERGRMHARAGRQYRSSGLGYVSFDGVASQIRVPWKGDAFAVDAWVGRSLVQGIHEPVTSSAISAVEDLAPERVGVVFGAAARWRPRPGLGLDVDYQRESRTDPWLYAERISADGSARVGASGSVDGALELDLATGDFNEARLRAQHALGGPLARAVGGRLAAFAEVRRHRPFFELWTIWGAFSPVGFTEAAGGLAWTTADARGSATLDAGWRRYEETHTGIDVLPMKSDGWRLGFGADWRATPTWVAHGAWRTEIGFGAARTDGELGARWQRDDDAWIGAMATVFQSVFEFKVGTGRVAGFGLDGGWRLRDDLRVAGDLALYQHRYRDLAPATDWSQRRASVRLEWTVGPDAGTAAAAGPR